MWKMTWQPEIHFGSIAAEPLLELGIQPLSIAPNEIVVFPEIIKSLGMKLSIFKKALPESVGFFDIQEPLFHDP